jgi:polyisoprenoid-binding protein YceI
MNTICRHVLVGTLLVLPYSAFAQNDAQIPSSSGREVPDVVTVQPLPESKYWGVDQAHCSVVFSINHSDLLDVYGIIPGRAFSGGAMLDDRDLTKSHFQITIKSAMLTTVGGWDDTFKGADGGLDVVRYPEITFVSEKVAKDGNGLQVTGALTLHGVTRDVTLSMEPSKIVGWKGTRFRAFQGKTVIRRQDFGINWVEPEHFTDPLFASEVRMTVIIELIDPPFNPAGPDTEKK